MKRITSEKDCHYILRRNKVPTLSFQSVTDAHCPKMRKHGIYIRA